jgi:hypothetical protein
LGKGETEAEELAGLTIGKSDKTVREWRDKFFESGDKNIIPALPLESIQKHFNKARHYMFAYLDGVPGGSDLEKLVKQYKEVVKSHCRISEKQ